MRKERINEIWGVVFLLCGLFTAASLVFFDPVDVSFYTSHPNSPVRNHTGFVGAYLAHALLVGFGLAAYLIPILFLIWSWSFFVQRIPERKIFKMLGLMVALVAASVFLGISFYSEKRFLRAGAVGYVLGGELLLYFGPLGSYILTGACFLLAILLATDFLIYPVVKAFWNSAKSGVEGCVLQMRRMFEFLAELRVRLHKPREDATKSRVDSRMMVFRAKTSLGVEPIVRTSYPAGDRTPQEKCKNERKDSVVKTPPDFEGPKIVDPVKKELQKESKPKVPPAAPTAPKTSPVPSNSGYRFPQTDLLRRPEPSVAHVDDLRYSSRIVEETLADFGIEAKVMEVEQGPVITRYELLPAAGVKVNRILSLADDLALVLKATSLRFIAPIPGKSAIGIEVPNSKIGTVYLRELIESNEFRKNNLVLPLVIGKDTSGKPLIADLAQMPHLLIAGTTGSGKTVCVNSIIAGLLFHSPPERLKFVMVDPKMVELTVYNTIPHMLAPVVTDTRKAAATLNWVVAEMENRYRLFANRGVRNIQSFNAQSPEALPYIVVVIDELADLMVVAQDKVEGAITRLAQLSRAVGIHLILATQRPSVDVITGVIKANFPARISFKVASKVDSRTVLDLNGADKLLGKGDLLFLQPGEAKLIRGQGAFVMDEEISGIAQFISSQKQPEYHPEISAVQEDRKSSYKVEKDELFDASVRIILETGVAAASTLQRRMRLGYTRAARIIDQMQMEGIVGPHLGNKPREILVDRSQALRETAAP